MQIAQVLAGYTLGGADLLRRAMGKKIQSEMDAQRHNSSRERVARGLERPRAELIFDQIGKVRRATAPTSRMPPPMRWSPTSRVPLRPITRSSSWLRRCARTSATPPTSSRISARNWAGSGIALLPPDRSEVASQSKRIPRPASQRSAYAVSAVRGGRRAGRWGPLVAEPNQGRARSNLFDFALRLDAKKLQPPPVRPVKAGAFESLNPNRAQSFAAAEPIAAPGEPRPEGARMGRRASSPGIAVWPMPALPPPRSPGGARLAAGRASTLQNEFEAIGFYLSSHPLASLEEPGARRHPRWVDSRRALAAGGSTRFRLAGIVIGKKERTSARGTASPLSNCRTASGVYEVTMFSEVLAQARALIDSGQPLIAPHVRREEENLRLTAKKSEPLDTRRLAGRRTSVPGARSRPCRRLKTLIGARPAAAAWSRVRPRPAEQTRSNSRSPAASASAPGSALPSNRSPE